MISSKKVKPCLKLGAQNVQSLRAELLWQMAGRVVDGAEPPGSFLTHRRLGVSPIALRIETPRGRPNLFFSGWKLKPRELRSHSGSLFPEDTLSTS